MRPNHQPALTPAVDIISRETRGLQGRCWASVSCFLPQFPHLEMGLADELCWEFAGFSGITCCCAVHCAEQPLGRTAGPDQDGRITSGAPCPSPRSPRSRFKGCTPTCQGTGVWSLEVRVKACGFHGTPGASPSEPLWCPQREEGLGNRGCLLAASRRERTAVLPVLHFLGDGLCRVGAAFPALEGNGADG